MSKSRATSAKARELQGKNAAAKRWNRVDRDDIAREYASQRIAEYIQRILESAPPLTDEQRTRLAELLRPTRRKAVVAERIAELDGGDTDAA